MTVSPPTLYWYQLETGVYAPDYYNQLDTTVKTLCAAQSVTAATAPWQNSITGTLLSEWLSQTDTAVRALCAALLVTPPITLLKGQRTGQYEALYFASLDGVVRALCTPFPTAVSFSPASPSIADDVIVGTLVSTATVAMNDGSSFSGLFALSVDDSGNFAASGVTVVSNVTPLVDGAHHVTATAAQNGVTISQPLTITVTAP